MLSFPVLGSTNDEAMARLRAGEPAPFVVTADRQTAGRGRHGRAWASPPGNLYMSLALVDPAPAALAPQLGFVVGVALGQVLRARLGGDVRLRLKWPNDAVFDGAKIAGLLGESTVLPGGRLGCVVGVGVNCLTHPADAATPATDLCLAGDPDPRPPVLLAELVARIDMLLRAWARGAGFAAIRAAWLELAANLGETIVVRTTRLALAGVFSDLDGEGRLRLRTASGMVSVEAGDVFLSPAGRTAADGSDAAGRCER